MKTCTFKKALSLLLAVMMVVSCITVLSVGAAAAKWDDNGWKTDAQALYNAYVNKAEWIPVGKNSGNGRYETSDESAEYIYAFAQDSTKIFAFIEVGAADKDIISPSASTPIVTPSRLVHMNLSSSGTQLLLPTSRRRSNTVQTLMTTAA